MITNPFNTTNTARTPYFKVNVNPTAGSPRPFLLLQPEFRKEAGREFPFDSVDEYSIYFSHLNRGSSLLAPDFFGLPDKVGASLSVLSHKGFSHLTRQITRRKSATAFVLDLKPPEGGPPVLAKWGIQSSVGAKLINEVIGKREYWEGGFWDLDSCAIFGWDRYKNGGKNESTISILSPGAKPAKDIYLKHGGTEAGWQQIMDTLNTTDLNHYLVVETEETQAEWVNAVLNLDGKGQRDPFSDEQFRNLARERRHARDDRRREAGLPEYNHLMILPRTFADDLGDEPPELDASQRAALLAAVANAAPIEF